MTQPSSQGPAPRVDRNGFALPVVRGLGGTWDVCFDGTAVWSVSVEGVDAGVWTVQWPASMRPWLRGVSHVTLRQGDRSHDLGEVRFGDEPGEGRVSFVDPHGIPVVIDKWGLVQRPFGSRDASVTAYMAEIAEQIIDVLARECGVHLWMAFGTLLGAARGGRAIAHDSDIDLAYLSEKPTPAEMAVEMYAMRRALSRAGMRVINKTGSFFTVAFDGPDGALASIDVYTCFYVGDLLHETATVRTKVPRSAILPLTTLEFEGRMLPAPADPDAMLAVSYGPGWRTPDPGFRHEPGPEIIDRFDGWFGLLMRQRRDWEAYWNAGWRDHHDNGSDFRSWVAARLEPGTDVIDVGCGRGTDVAAFAADGFGAWGVDYARRAFKEMDAGDPRQRRFSMNLYELRDTLSSAAIMARTAADRRVVYARNLLDALAPDGRDHLWRYCAMVLRGGGRMYAELDEIDAKPGEIVRFAGRGGRQFRVRIAELEGEWRAAGAREVERHRVPLARPPLDGEPDRVRWRIVLDWD